MEEKARDRRKEDSEISAPIYRCASRIFQDGGQWWFDTREGKQEGPFVNKSEAEGGLMRFLGVMNSSFALSSDLSLIEKGKETK